MIGCIGREPRSLRRSLQRKQLGVQFLLRILPRMDKGPSPLFPNPITPMQTLNLCFSIRPCALSPFKLRPVHQRIIGFAVQDSGITAGGKGPKAIRGNSVLLGNFERYWDQAALRRLNGVYAPFELNIWTSGLTF